MYLYVQGHSPCKFMYDPYTAEIYRLTVCVYLYSLLHSSPRERATLCTVVHYGRSSSHEVGTNQKSTYAFPLVFRCNYVPMFYHFRDIKIQSLKICVFHRFHPPQSHLKPSQGGSLGPKGFPWDLGGSPGTLASTSYRCSSVTPTAPRISYQT